MACEPDASCAGRAARTLDDLEVEGEARHEDVVRTAKVEPLPILRMKVTTRLVVRGRGREPRPQSLTPRLNFVHAQAARAAMLCSCETKRLHLHRLHLLPAS